MAHARCADPECWTCNAVKELETENKLLRAKILDLEQCLAEYDNIVTKYDELRTKLLLAQQTINAMRSNK